MEWKEKKSTRINQAPIARKSSSSSSSSDSSDSKVSFSEMGPKVKEKPKNQSKSPKALNRSSTPLSFSDSLDLQKWNGKRKKSTWINPNLQQQETNLHPLQTFQIPLILKIVLQKWTKSESKKPKNQSKSPIARNTSTCSSSSTDPPDSEDISDKDDLEILPYEKLQTKTRCKCSHDQDTKAGKSRGYQDDCHIFPCSCAEQSSTEPLPPSWHSSLTWSSVWYTLFESL